MVFIKVYLSLAVSYNLILIFVFFNCFRGVSKITYLRIFYLMNTELKWAVLFNIHLIIKHFLKMLNVFWLIIFILLSLIKKISNLYDLLTLIFSWTFILILILFYVFSFYLSFCLFYDACHHRQFYFFYLSSSYFSFNFSSEFYFRSWTSIESNQLSSILLTFLIFNILTRSPWTNLLKFLRILNLPCFIKYNPQ
jgi:hypothetical protein